MIYNVKRLIFSATEEKAMLKLDGWIMDYYHAKGYVIDYPKTKNYMFLLFKQSLTVWINGQPIYVGPDHCILYEPEMRKYYCGEQDGYYHDCVFLSGEEVGALAEELGIPLNTPFHVNDAEKIDSLIRSIADETVVRRNYSELVIDLKVRILFYKLADMISRTEQESRHYYRQLSELRREVLMSPEKEWNVEELAEKMHLSVSRFQHVYKELFFTTFRQDLIKSRMGYAKLLLRNSSQSAAEVAAACGYNNAEHFFRQFKKHTGITPVEYRKEFGEFAG